MKPFDVSHIASKRSAVRAEEMCKELKSVIYNYENEMSLALALGVLDIVKKELIDEHIQGEE
jgi:hypothetical protein